MNQHLPTRTPPLPPQQKAWLGSVATVYLQCHQYAKAQPLLLLLVKLYPRDPDPLKQLAYLYYQQGLYARALRCCQRFDKVHPDPGDRGLHLLKSFCYLKMDQQELASDNYRRFSAMRAQP